MMIVKHSVECELVGGTKVPGENLPQLHFSSQIPHDDPGSNPGHRGGKPATNRPSYGTAFNTELIRRVGAGTGSTRHVGHYWPIVPAPGDCDNYGEFLVEWRLAGETQVLGENLTQRHFFHHKSHLPDPGSNPGRRGGKPATNRLSYGAALMRN
jgi:hypothetical protein